MIPSIRDLELPLLKLLSKHDYLSWDDCTDHLSKHFSLTDEEKNDMMPNGKCRRIKYYVGWAKANLKRSGLVDAKKRGVYYITEKGKRYLNKLI
ncbi:MAG: hypothetical protein HDS97_03505 [Bacteroidales bacterium]|nr:hypothetical protein [Bacteroidales bacterium]